MKKLAVVLVLLSFMVFVVAISPIRYWCGSPEERAREIVESDVLDLMESGQVGDFWSSLRDVQLNYTDGSILHYLSPKNIPVPLAEDGKFEMQIQVIRWIEGHKYGLVMDFEIFDVKSQNKVAEFGRTYHIGYIW